MSNSAILGLPYVQAAQAQKHIAVNEALARLDGLVQLILQSVTQTSPPVLVAEGIAYAVPVGATGAWIGAEGQLAVARNGGWDFVAPSLGWRAYIVDALAPAIHDGTGWLIGGLAVGANGAGIALRVAEIDQTIAPGLTSQTPAIIPANALVFGVTGRVLADLTGTLASWQLGNPGSPGRFGTGLGLAAGAYVHGMLGQPTTYYAAESLLIEAVGGSFAGGVIRLSVHYLELSVPRT
ncbi:MAG: hypothetical protein RLZZ528_391 [Pseudomonadota bacterium]|jgi:hypothetical protein